MEQKTNKVNFAFDRHPDGKIVPMREMKSNIVREIPAGTYRLEFDRDIGMYLMPVNDFKLPERIYGKVNNYAQRFMRAYELGNKNLGALLIGDPGSGKTLTLKQVAVLAVQMGYPMILIDKPWPGDMLSAFLNTITQPCVVGVDEFDKKYGEKVSQQPGQSPQDQPADIQNSILEMLDGASSGDKKLFVLTANDDNRISEYMKDRPSRIRYTISFKRIEREAALDYVNANLKNATEENIRAFLALVLADAGPSKGMNFDSMVELVKEMNDFDCTLDEALELMIRNGKKSYTSFEITVFHNGEKVQKVGGHGRHQSAYINGNSDYSIDTMLVLPPAEGEEVSRRVNVNLDKEHFVGFGEDLDMYEFRYGDFTFMAKLVGYNEAMKANHDAEKEYTELPDVKAYKEKSIQRTKETGELPKSMQGRSYLPDHMQHLPEMYNMDSLMKANFAGRREAKPQKLKNSNFSGAHVQRNGTYDS